MRGRHERVRFDDVRAHLQVRAVDFCEYIRTGERYYIARAHERMGVIREAHPAVVLFAEAVGLDHRAHAAVEDQHSSGQFLAEPGDPVDGGGVPPSGREGRLWAGGCSLCHVGTANKNGSGT